jgi:2,3-bisphosphoglycerate-independent phosphoglycerate mutase
MQPQMSCGAVGDAVITAMENDYDFVVVNFANGDMVGHTGNFEAATVAVEAVDEQLGRIVEMSKKQDYAVVITSDHGNCEEMRDDAGNTLTNHTVGKVWCFVMGDGVTSVHTGALNNIAPTVLKLMGLDVPLEMDSPLI